MAESARRTVLELLKYTFYLILLDLEKQTLFAYTKQCSMESNKEKQLQSNPAVPVIKIGETVILRPDSVIGEQEEPSVTTPTTGEVYSRRQEVGRLLVEAPQGEISEVIPFTKKVGDFTPSELLATAGKIKVENVSLREMLQLGRIDELALRRLVGIWLEGGNIDRETAREADQQERKYERDPRLRQVMLAGQVGVQGGIGQIEPEVDSLNDGDQATRKAPKASPYKGSRPTPDAATLKSVRNKQILTVAGTAVAVAISVMVLLRITR